jgi:transcriptional regulator with XRE-family HTH domain
MKEWTSETIRNFRLSQGWSQAEIAEKVGVSKNMVWYWESGKKNPSDDSLLRLDDLEKSVRRLDKNLTEQLDKNLTDDQNLTDGEKNLTEKSNRLTENLTDGEKNLTEKSNRLTENLTDGLDTIPRVDTKLDTKNENVSNVSSLDTKFDRYYVTNVLSFFHRDSGGIVEVRIFPEERYLTLNGRREYVGKTVSGYYTDYAKAAQDFSAFDGHGNIYFTLNPVNPNLLARSANRLKYSADKTTSDDDIISDRWLPIDIDPVRPSDVSSTDDELKLAQEQLTKVVEWLSQFNIPTITGISGNGTHILIPLIGYPNNQETRRKKERFIKFLSEKFSDDKVSIDGTVFNMARIWKLYGTLAVKGDSIPERPHRRAYLKIPEVIPEPVDLYAKLDEIIPPDWTPKDAKTTTRGSATALSTIQPKRKTTTRTNGDYPLLNVEAYLQHYGVEYKVKEKAERIIYELFPCPFNPEHNHGEAHIAQCLDGKMEAACKHDSCAGKGWQEFKAAIGDPKPFYEKIQRPKKQIKATSKIQMEMQVQTEEPTYIHLTDIEKAEYEGLSVVTDVLLPGVGRDDSFFVPKKVEVTCAKEDKSKCDGCPLIEEGAYTYEFADDDRRLIRFTKQTDEQVRGEIRKALFLPKKCSEYKFNVEDYTEIQILLAVPKAGAELRKEGGKFVDEHGRDFREKVIYYSGVVPRSNAYYQVSGAVVADPKSQRATMLANRLVKLQNEYEQFTVTENAKALLRDFQTEDLSAVGIDNKMRELGRDMAYNIAHYFGEPRVNIVIADMLAWHSVLQFPFDGDMMTKGWIDLLIFGDSGINKTTHLRKLRNAIDFGYFVDGGAVSRAGLLYSLDDVHSGIRILRWGALPLNDGQLVIIDESQNISLDVWQEMSSARTTGLLTVTKAKHGEHPMRSRQIYTANPKPPNTMSSFSFPIRGIKDLMRPADMRRFDIVICAARGEVEVDEVNRLQAERGEIEPHRITPEHLKASIARAWTRRPEHVIWADGAEAAVMDIATKLQRRFGCGDIPVIDIDAKDKVARGAVAVATMLNSTDSTFEPIIVKPGHANWIGMYLMGIYSAQAAMLDKHAQVTGKMERIADLETDIILQEWQQLNPPEPEHLAEMAIIIAEGEGIERDVLAAQIGIEPQSISRLIKHFKQHNLVKTTRKGYYATPRLVKFYRAKYDELSKFNA